MSRENDNGDEQYTAEFYEKWRESARRSAQVVLPIAFDIIHPENILDVGCGTGAWLKVASEINPSIAVRGTEKRRPPTDVLDIPENILITEDATSPEFARGAKYDLTICLEVAEHVAPESADILIANLIASSDCILFSAAIPGQKGVGHVNEQWPGYWAEKFAAHRYFAIDIIRPRVWNDSRVRTDYAMNTILYVKESKIRACPTLTRLLALNNVGKFNGTPSLVHPAAFAAQSEHIEKLAKKIPGTPAIPPDTKPHHIFLGLPGGAHPLAVGAVMRLAESKHDVTISTAMSSSLTGNFNALWCAALNGRQEHGFTHFAMIHSDVVPRDENWLDRLMSILDGKTSQGRRPPLPQSTPRDLVSVIIPIKDSNGLTSAGFDTHQWRPRRLTMHETIAMPETWGNEFIRKMQTGEDGQADFGPTDGPLAPLLFNTGLWLCRIDQPWCEKVHFEIRNRIRRDNDNRFVADFAPEDWEFSRLCNSLGVNTCVTRAIEVNHIGVSAFGNQQAWGSLKTDTVNIPFATRATVEKK